jgi:Protein of unknown function (DUF4058)
MPSPFPGMDPYLESRSIWPDLHLSLILGIRDALAAQVGPNYYVRAEQRTYVAEVERDDRLRRPDVAVITLPDAPDPSGGGVATVAPPMTQTVLLPRLETIREGYLEIRDTGTHEVVTAIELLSPTNKVPGEGRRKYEEKRQEVLNSATSLVEIDLLRGGQPMAMEPIPAGAYRILVAPGWERPRARLTVFQIRSLLPELSVPLRRGEAEPRVDLASMLASLYDRARYDVSVDYRLAPPEPPPSPEDAAWTEELLRAAGLRGEADS